VGVCDLCDDYDYGIKQVAGNDDYDYGIKQAGNDDYDYDEGRYLFFGLVAQGRRTSSYRRRAERSPSMQHLVFWPHAGAWGAGVRGPPCAQLLWCELYVYEEFKKKKKRKKLGHDSTRCRPILDCKRLSYEGLPLRLMLTKHKFTLKIHRGYTSR